MAVSDLEKNGKPHAAGNPQRPWTARPRPKKEDKDLSQWPKGTSQPLTKLMADRLFSLISTSENSLAGILREHPELPSYRDMMRWRKTQPWFAAGWNLARQQQAEWLMQRALDLQKNATKETAHLVRVRFDILRHIANKLHPEVWGERPALAPNISTTVQVGVISQEQVADLRTRLEATRAWLQNKDGAKAKSAHRSETRRGETDPSAGESKDLSLPRERDRSIPG